MYEGNTLKSVVREGRRKVVDICCWRGQTLRGKRGGGSGLWEEGRRREMSERYE